MNNPVTSSDITLLNTLAACANMTADEVFKDFEIMANKKILENHKYEIYYSESEKSWRTYLPDDTKPNNRRPIKRKRRNAVNPTFLPLLNNAADRNRTILSNHKY